MLEVSDPYKDLIVPSLNIYNVFNTLILFKEALLSRKRFTERNVKQ